MAWIAMSLFIALFMFGDTLVGWSDPGGRVQLALFSAFIFGTISGYRAKS
jgi:hypothetical protein